MSAMSLTSSVGSPLDALSAADAKGSPGLKAKTRAAAVDFEAVFLNSMFSQMYAGLDGEGPFGGGAGTGVWRSFLTDQYSRSFAQKGGIGIADKVYQELLARQEVTS